MKRFLDPRSCSELLGNLRHGKIGSLPVSLLYFQLDGFLRRAGTTFSPDVGTIPERLLEHNLKADRSKATSEMLSIDADVVFRYDTQHKKTNIEFKAYFQNPGFERPVEHHRVVLHVLIEEAGGLKRSISPCRRAQARLETDAGHNRRGQLRSRTSTAALVDAQAARPSCAQRRLDWGAHRVQRR
jgi:hypothetical protein